MKKRALLLILVIAFDTTYSLSQKLETGINIGFGDASIRNGIPDLRKSVPGYTIGVYIEQYVLENVSLQSSIQYMEKGAGEALNTSGNYEAYLDFIQYSFTPKIYFDEGTRNKFVLGVGFYFGINCKERFNNDFTPEKKYAFSTVDMGLNALIGIKIDKYVLVLIQSQVSASPMISKPENAGNHVYVGLNLSVPVFSFNVNE